MDNGTRIGNSGVKIIENNSEILYIYDARMCNPNGDPDDENKPRMDYSRNVNLVSDVRLKRYIRDYLMDYKDKTIFVSKVGGETVDATGRLRYLYFVSQIISAITSDGMIDESKLDSKVKKILNKELNNEKTRKEKLEEFIAVLRRENKDLKVMEVYNGLSEKLEIKVSGNGSDLADIKDSDIVKLSDKYLLSELIDVRLFGATMPIKSETGSGSSRTFTGPIQFNWGYSLNKVTGPMDSSGITSTFAGAKEEYGTMGKDYRVDYSLIAFHGIISAKRAEHTNLTYNDVNMFDDAMIKAIPLEATTRSKTGQSPLLYIRVEYNTPEFFSGDFRRYVKIAEKGEGEDMPLDETAKLRSSDDYKLDLTKLSEKLGKHSDKIVKIYFWKSQDIEIKGWGNQGGKLKTTNSAKKEIEITIITLPKTEKGS